MIPYRALRLDEIGQRIYQSTIAFLQGRLLEASSLEWATHLKDEDVVQRKAVLDLLDRSVNIPEPWGTAWRLVEESWNTPTVNENPSVDAYVLRHRLRSGDRSGAMVDRIVATVSPVLKISPISDWQRRHNPRQTRVRSFRDVFSARISSVRGFRWDVLDLESISDPSFLAALATGLESAVEKGLDIARRMGWKGGARSWQVGQLHRAYVVRANELPAGNREPDESHYGIAPAVKLLYMTVERLGAIDRNLAASFLERWRFRASPIHLRLWAAIARNELLVPINDVTNFLLTVDRSCVWNVHDYPEIAELRARRFAEINTDARKRLLSQIRRGPPRSFWRKDLPDEQVHQAKTYWIARELRRLEVGGFHLPDTLAAWLRDHADSAPRIPMRIDEGFPSSASAMWVGEKHDARYDELRGVERLSSLEASLAAGRNSWSDDPAEGASAWIRRQGHAQLVLTDLESAPDAGAAYPMVWDRFGWFHSPNELANKAVEARRVLVLLSGLPDATLRAAIDGLANWFYAWSSFIEINEQTLATWQRIWSIGVEATNARDATRTETELNSVVRTTDPARSAELDTLNTAAGKLIEVFLRSCPPLNEKRTPFAEGPCRTMRDEILRAKGSAGLVSRYRLIESIGYFLNADRAWADETLLQPLHADSAESLQLWHALAHRIHPREVIQVIGISMADRASDTRLGRDAREVFTANLVIEGLYSILEERPPALDKERITQTLRSVEDEVRAHAADTIRRFVSELSPEKGAEFLVRNVVVSFMENIWPQERSLTTPGISRAFAQLPAVAGAAFTDALAAIERYLVPFDCWSLIDYGLFGDDSNGPRLALIDTPEKAAALLKLLGLTIGRGERAVVPHDLSDALEQIRAVAPSVAATPDFRWLATVARGG